MRHSDLQPEASTVSDAERRRPLPVARACIAGILMGLANLVPGISGGTMILVMGLYEDFVESIAEITRLRFARRNVLLLGLIGGAAGVAITSLAGTLSRAVTLHPSAMFSVFIGLTLGGAPLLVKMIRPFSARALLGVVVGLTLMILVTVTRDEPADKEAVREAARRGEFIVQPNYDRDLVAGVLGISAMVLPGISGAYMLLVLNRYEAILAAISLAKHYVLSAGGEGDPAVFLGVLIPTAIGALAGLVAISNVLKWMLLRYEKATLGLLLGILLGSVVGIWPFGPESGARDVLVGAALAGGGFAFTALLSRISR